MTIYVIFLFLILHTHSHAFTVQDYFTQEAAGARCNIYMHRYARSYGVGNINTLEACAEDCYAQRDTCKAFAFYHSGSYAQRCDLLRKSCITHGPIESFADTDLYFIKNETTWREDAAMDRFVKIGDLKACKDVNRIDVSKGAYADNTLESCAAECYQDWRCVAFSHKAYNPSRDFKCEKYTRGCEPEVVEGNTLIEDQPESDLFLATYYTRWPLHLPATLRSFFDSSTFHVYDDEFFFPEARRCAAYGFDFGADTAGAHAYAHMYCEGEDAGGYLFQYPYDYPADTYSPDICAKLCYHYNSVQRNKTCAAFNVVYNNDTGTFRCDMYSCGVFDTNIAFNASVHTQDKFGFLDTMRTPACAGVNLATPEEYLLARDYTVEFRQHCTSNIAARYDKMSATHCAQFCDQRVNCVGFEIRDDRECKLQRKCNSMSESGRHSFYYSKRNYTKVAYQNAGVLDELYLHEERGVSCVNSQGKLATLTAKNYLVHECDSECKALPACTLFELDNSFRCHLYSACDVQERYPAVSAISQVFTYLTRSQMDEYMVVTSTEPLKGVAENSCQTSTDCVGFFDVCDKNLMCEEYTCNTHSDCYPYFRKGRLPMCDLKNKRCVDYYESNCVTVSQCHNAARRQWRKKRSLTEARAEMKLIKTEAKKSYLTRLKEGLDNIPHSSHVYIAIIANETLSLDVSNLQGYTESEIVALLRTLRCGSLASECTVSLTPTAPSRRLLQSAGGFTVEITFDVDDTALQELIDSGYDFNNTGFIEALANTLNVTSEDIQVNVLNGTIELEAIIVDTLGPNETLTDDILVDIENIQNSLDELTAALELELGLQDTQVDAINLCGTRNCTNRGVCEPTTGLCACEPGFYGVDCQFDTPYPTAAPTPAPTPIGPTACTQDAHCAAGGTCDLERNACVCVYPAYGPRCENVKNCTCTS